MRTRGGCPLSTLPFEKPLTRVDSVIDSLQRARNELGDALSTMANNPTMVERAADLVAETLDRGNRVFTAGNGGSAAEAQHFAAELVGRFRFEREPYAAIALTADSTVLTALANDYGYQEVFARQLAAQGRPGDLLVLFSTSGQSRNLLVAAESARRMDIRTIGILGTPFCALGDHCDLVVAAGSVDTCRIQEIHAVITHVVCEVVEAQLTESTRSAGT